MQKDYLCLLNKLCLITSYFLTYSVALLLSMVTSIAGLVFEMLPGKISFIFWIKKCVLPHMPGEIARIAQGKTNPQEAAFPDTTLTSEKKVFRSFRLKPNFWTIVQRVFFSIVLFNFLNLFFRFLSFILHQFLLSQSTDLSHILLGTQAMTAAQYTVQITGKVPASPANQGRKQFTEATDFCIDLAIATYFKW